MKILILGAGTVGGTVAYNLANYSNYEITVIDQDEMALQKLNTKLDIQTLLGNATSPSVLAAAGAQDTELLIAATATDDTNLVACRLAKEIFNIPKIIARVRQSEIMEYDFTIAENEAEVKSVPVSLFNANQSICPEQIVTEQLTQLLDVPGALQVIDFGAQKQNEKNAKTVEDDTSKIQLIVTRVQNTSPFIGHTLAEFDAITPKESKAKICMIYRNETLIIPNDKNKLISGDEVYFLCEKKWVSELMNSFRPNEIQNKRIMIAGGGNIGMRLAQALTSRYQVKVIEKNPLRTQHLAEVLNEPLVLEGTATDEELLHSERVDEVDMFFALTNDNEDNIMSSLLAKRLGAKRVAAIINNSIYISILVGNAIDIMISPHLATIGSLLAHIRKGDVVAVHPLRRGEAEALEVIIHGDENSSKLAGRQIQSINWPHGIHLAGVISDGQLITHNQHVLKENDHLICVVFRKKAVRELEKLLQVTWQFF